FVLQVRHKPARMLRWDVPDHGVMHPRERKLEAHFLLLLRMRHLFEQAFQIRLIPPIQLLGIDNYLDSIANVLEYRGGLHCLSVSQDMVAIRAGLGQFVFGQLPDKVAHGAAFIAHAAPSTITGWRQVDRVRLAYANERWCKGGGRFSLADRHTELRRHLTSIPHSCL